MQGDGAAMLFAPPQPPFQLPHTGAVVLGRSRECELRLGDVDTSRRHAKIVCEGGRFVLHDLASTNGTFVNGERIERRELEPGDRLQIGANMVTFCQVSGQVSEGFDAPDDGMQTQVLDRDLRGGAFRGDLAEIPPFAVIQILEMGRKTGLLAHRLRPDARQALAARRRSRTRRDQGSGGLRRRGGARAREPGPVHVRACRPRPPSTRSRRRLTPLLLEASRRLDEGLC